MKNTIFRLTLTCVSVLFVVASASFTKPPKQKKSSIGGINWSTVDYNFGDVKIGPNATAVFKFKNKRPGPLKISKVEPGCSCTVSSFTSETVKHNKSGEISASYTTKERPGFFKKMLMVTFEDGTTQQLTITGNVIFE